MRYRTGRSGEEKARDLDPYRVWYRGGALYVVGLDHLSGEIRTFAVGRILEIDALEESFEIRADFDFDAYIDSAFGVIAETPTQVHIRFDPRWAEWVAERTWHPSQELERHPSGHLDLRMEVGGVADLRSWVLSFGSGAEVLAPGSLREEVKSELEAGAARYRTATSDGAAAKPAKRKPATRRARAAPSSTGAKP